MSGRKKDPLVSADNMLLVKDALHRITEAMPVIQALELCGNNCDHWRELFKQQEEQLRLIQQHFGGY